MKPIAVLQRVLPFLLAGSACFAEDLAGRVKLSSGDTAEVVLATALLPSINDKVDIFFKQRGEQGELLVGSGHVTEVESDVVRLKIERATGTVTKEHYVKIHSSNPQKRKAGAPVVLKDISVKVKNSVPPELMPVQIPSGKSKAGDSVTRAADAVSVDPPKPAKAMASAQEEPGAAPPGGEVPAADGKTAKDHYNEGFARHKAGEREAAVEAYTRAIEVDPNYAAAYYNRACIYLVKKEYDGLINDTTKALELGHKSRANLLCFRGTGWAGKGNYDKALADHSAAIEIDPTYALAYNNRGNDYYHKRDLTRAVKDCDKSIDLDPYSPLPWYNRGYMNYSLRKHSNAVADWQKALELQPEYAAELEPLIKKLAGK